MPLPDVLTLVRRDHDELDQALRVMSESIASERELREAQEAVELGLAAHVEGEGRALRGVLELTQPPALVYLLCSQLMTAHVAQEAALVQLKQARIGTASWRERAAQLRALVRQHHAHEEACVLPALRDYVPRATYAGLAGRYATARLRSLGTIPMPSGVDALRRAS
ncbi:MAG TPA: hypothetical protein VFQ53_38860 [Kofleriaceae bacterium]|nr:hypothetical protein [Kofleriaceae bacterium]